MDLNNSIINEFVIGRIVWDNVFIGVGYNDGNGIWGYDIYLFYNVNVLENFVCFLVEFWFGLIYNF